MAFVSVITSFHIWLTDITKQRRQCYWPITAFMQNSYCNLSTSQYCFEMDSTDTEVDTKVKITQCYLPSICRSLTVI